MNDEECRAALARERELTGELTRQCLELQSVLNDLLALMVAWHVATSDSIERVQRVLGVSTDKR